MRPQTSKDESVVNVERSIGGISKQRGWPSRLKALDDVSGVALDHRPDESGKSPLTLSKAIVIGEEGIEYWSQS
jgi:hypothetical protein